MKIEFKKYKDTTNDYDLADITLSFEKSGITHREITEYFNDFLKACGFVFKGSIELVENEEF